ncbi:hypothetical protein SADUNF_Sadunf01G0016300 [Salix dunnii]|uniref:Uncharacterized protein n=1 Tax=Salix dunnii TaxID=1413687 RepID=A0A835TJH8_9ROSI|nr:hypothetical protein SADUNF_Sadunf01G0016300 [Salix dunnii]
MTLLNKFELQFSTKGLPVGLKLALAIALHNIPEGVAVALPIYFATQSQVFKIRVAAVIGVELVATMAFQLATVSGFAEPLDVVLVAYLFPSSFSPEILEGLLASVGGVMAFLTLHEMLPLAFDYAGQKQAVKAVFFGMAFMSASLYFLEISLPEEMSLINLYNHLYVVPRALGCAVCCLCSATLISDNLTWPEGQTGGTILENMAVSSFKHLKIVLIFLL